MVTEENLGSESAYPLPAGTTQVKRWQAGYGEYRTTEAVATSGLTKRELFAAMAMQGLLSAAPYQDLMADEALARTAVTAADVLLKELAK